VSYTVVWEVHAIGTWRVLYRPDGATVTVHVLKVGRSA
jgi:hypothetical protein